MAKENLADKDILPFPTPTTLLDDRDGVPDEKAHTTLADDRVGWRHCVVRLHCSPLMAEMER